MAKSSSFLTLLSLLFVITFAAAPSKVAEKDAEQLTNESERRYRPRPCPCKCFTGYHNEEQANRQCYRSSYKHCEMSDCKKGHRKGKHCCGGSIAVTPSATSSPKPTCPCKCTSKYRANRQCKALYGYCKVIECNSYPTEYSNGPVHRRPKFQCCDDDQHH